MIVFFNHFQCTNKERTSQANHLHRPSLLQHLGGARRSSAPCWSHRSRATPLVCSFGQEGLDAQFGVAERVAGFCCDLESTSALPIRWTSDCVPSEPVSWKFWILGKPHETETVKHPAKESGPEIVTSICVMNLLPFLFFPTPFPNLWLSLPTLVHSARWEGIPTLLPLSHHCCWPYPAFGPAKTFPLSFILALGQRKILHYSDSFD